MGMLVIMVIDTCGQGTVKARYNLSVNLKKNTDVTLPGVRRLPRRWRRIVYTIQGGRGRNSRNLQ
jgi:hypothetical protein